MEIQTSFDLSEVVWLIHENVIMKGYVKLITTESQIDSKEGTATGVKSKHLYKIDCIGNCAVVDRNHGELFKTKEHLIEYISRCIS